MASGALVGGLAGITSGGSLLYGAFGGAAIGAAADISSQVVSNSGPINTDSIAVAAIAGAIGGGAGKGLMNGMTSLLDTALLSAAFSGAADLALRIEFRSFPPARECR